MTNLVLLVLAAVWMAVLIPPLLRSRVENRPNSSVTDFRRQLNKLQSTVPHRASGSMRGMARPLAQSPLQRPAVGGRPGAVPAQMRRTGTRQHGSRGQNERAPRPAEMFEARGTTLTPSREPQRRQHGDPTGGQRRPAQRAAAGQHRQSQVHRNAANHDQARRRRSNVLFMLILACACTLFFAATTKDQAMLYLFVVSFLALFAYGYLLSQARQREQNQWGDEWMPSSPR